MPSASTLQPLSAYSLTERFESLVTELLDHGYVTIIIVTIRTRRLWQGKS